MGLDVNVLTLHCKGSLSFPSVDLALVLNLENVHPLFSVEYDSAYALSPCTWSGLQEHECLLSGYHTTGPAPSPVGKGTVLFCHSD